MANGIKQYINGDLRLGKGAKEDQNPDGWMTLKDQQDWDGLVQHKTEAKKDVYIQLDTNGLINK